MTQAIVGRATACFTLAVLLVASGSATSVTAQTNTPAPSAPQAAPADKAAPGNAASPTKAAPSSPAGETAPSSTPPTTPPVAADKAPGAPMTGPGPGPATKPPAPTPEGIPLAPGGKAQTNEIEPNASPSAPGSATTENVEVPARPMEGVTGTSSYDEAFKSIKASLEAVQAAMAKAGVKPSGHPITVFSAPDDKGFKYQAGVPVAQKPEKGDLGGGIGAMLSPSGKAIKFQHRGPYDDIDSTYDVITAFLDAKGLQVDSPYIEEYLTELTTADDPNLQVDIYVFVK